MTAATSEVVFEGWAILELMGHRRLAGHVSEVEIAGQRMLRLDVPGDRCAACGHPEGRHTSGGMCGGHADGDECYCVMFPPLETTPAATQFYSPAALYCLTPTTEAIARRLATRPAPAQRWELEPPREAHSVRADDADFEIDDRDDGETF